MEINENENENSTPMGYSKSSAERFMAIEAYLKKLAKHSINNITFHLKQ